MSFRPRPAFATFSPHPTQVFPARENLVLGRQSLLVVAGFARCGPLRRSSRRRSRRLSFPAFGGCCGMRTPPRTKYCGGPIGLSGASAAFPAVSSRPGPGAPRQSVDHHTPIPARTCIASWVRTSTAAPLSAPAVRRAPAPGSLSARFLFLARTALVCLRRRGAALPPWSARDSAHAQGQSRFLVLVVLLYHRGSAHA